MQVAQEGGGGVHPHLVALLLGSQPRLVKLCFRLHFEQETS